MQERDESKITQKHRIIPETFYLPVILLLTLVLYWQTFPFEFVYDDVSLLFDNNYINGKNYTNIWDVFIPGFVMTAIYTPLTFLFYTFIFRISHGTPFAFHMSALLLYLVSICFLYDLLKKILHNDLIVFLAVALYAFHPAHVENTAWISAAGYNLAACFAFASFSLFIDILRDDSKAKQPVRYILFLFASLCSVLCQPAATVFPALLLLYAFCFMKDKFAKAFKLSLLPFVFSAVSAYLFKLTIEQRIDNMGRFDVSVNYSFFHKIQAAGRYLFNSFIPYDLMPIYSVSDNIFYTLFIVVCLILALICFLKGRKTFLLFCGFWFLISSLPYLNIFYSTSYLMNDRYLLFPSVASCIAIALICFASFKWLEKKFFYMRFIPAAVVLIFYFLSSFTYIPVWSTNLNLWHYAYKKNPKSFVVIELYSSHLINSKNYIQNYKAELSKFLDSLQDYNIKFKFLVQLGAVDEAYIFYTDKLLSHENLLTWINLSYLYLQKGDFEKSCAIIDNLKYVRDNLTDYYANYDVRTIDDFLKISFKSYYYSGRIKDVFTVYNLIVSRDNHDLGLYNMVRKHSENSDLKHVKEFYVNYLLKLPATENPAYISKFLHILLLQEHYGSSASEILQITGKKNVAADKLMKEEKYKAAELLLLDILQRDPYSEEANLNLGIIYVKQKKYNDGIKYLEAAVKCNPSSKDILELIDKCRMQMN